MEYAIEVNHEGTLDKIKWLRSKAPDLWTPVTLRTYSALFDISYQHGKPSGTAIEALKKAWAAEKPRDQINMVDRFSEEVSKAKPEWGLASYGRRKGILYAKPSEGGSWKKVENKLLKSLLGEDKCEGPMKAVLLLIISAASLLLGQIPCGVEGRFTGTWDRTVAKEGLRKGKGNYWSLACKVDTTNWFQLNEWNPKGKRKPKVLLTFRTQDFGCYASDTYAL